MLILENREKIMDDGLETKAPGFLVDQLLSYPQKNRKNRKKQNKAESAVKSCILILDGQKGVKINPELEINHSQDIDGMY